MKIVLLTIFSCFLAFGLSAQIDTATAQIDSLCIEPLDSISIAKMDSIFSHNPFVAPLNIENFNKLPVQKKIISQNIKSEFKTNIFLLMLNLISIWVLLLNFSRNKIKKVLATLFNLNMLKHFANIESKRNNNYLWAYFLLLNLLLTVLFYVMAQNFNIEFNIVKLFLIIFTFLLFDTFFNKLFAFTLNQKDNFYVLLFNDASFLILSLPFIIISLLLLVFLPKDINTIFGYSFLVGAILIYIWKEFRVLFILGSNKIKIFSFYFFLYLCTFKFLPLAIIFKTVWVELIK